MSQASSYKIHDDIYGISYNSLEVINQLQHYRMGSIYIFYIYIYIDIYLFKLEHKRTSTTLSDHVWKLKKKNINFNISWQVVKRVKPFAPSNKVCGLCLQEKLSILRSAPSLNKRSEIFGHCIHRKKFLLSNLSMSTDEVSIADRNSES